jgi:hypothetical protein
VKILTEEKSYLALDTEVAAGWWWYDGKTTHRLMIFVGQWFDPDGVAGISEVPPFGWILLPDILFKSKAIMHQYRGLPVVTRRVGLHRITETIRMADVLVGHNLSGFDIGTINGELMLKNMPLLPEREVVDTLNNGPKGVFQQRSLANRLSRLEGTVEKPHVDPVVWEAAFNEFDPVALAEVYHRAVTDVQGHIDLFVNDREKRYV